MKSRLGVAILSLVVPYFEGAPSSWYTTEIEARGTKTISMRELLVDGKIGVCIGPPDAGSRIMGTARCTLTTGCEYLWHVPNPNCERKVGGRHTHTIGYVTLDAVTRCDDLTSPEDPRYETRTEPLLTGTFEQIANGKVFERGPLGSEVRPFRKPATPRDPLAKRPPRTCAPIPPTVPAFTANMRYCTVTA
ncbi:MAG: hypothetical protein AABO58_20400 [Acidobacteriota bacterium]